MDGRIEVSIEMPVDDDGFLRRQCPSCDQQFKWYAHDSGDPDAEPVHQFFCPLCGAGAAVDDWSTPEQVDHARHAAGPTLDRYLQDAVADAFKGVKGMAGFKPDRGFSLGLPDPDPLTEENDMSAVVPPCHPNEPIKVPDGMLERVHCLICGAGFAA